MLFSVIIPIYNAEKTLRRCLDSLVPQIGRQAELILINDGSTDGTDGICREYAEGFSSIQYIPQNNRGVSAARNRGLQAASGAYVSFVDSDDLVSPDYFAVLAQRPEVDLLVFGEQISQNGKVTNSIIPTALAAAQNYEAFTEAFVRSRNGSPCNKRFRRSILTENGIAFPEDLRIGEDFVFCLRYLTHARSAAAVEACVYLIDESDSMSNSRKYNPDITSQALLNYRYSFDTVLDSDLSFAQKDRLTRIMDYNYYRTAFACVQELLKREKPRYWRLRPDILKTLTAFSTKTHSAPPIGLSHRMMRICVNHCWTFLSYLIARLKYSRKRRGV